MNRRGFIGSLAALVGVVGAKVKGAPALAAEPRLTATGAMIAEANKYPAKTHYMVGYADWKVGGQGEGYMLLTPEEYRALGGDKGPEWANTWFTIDTE